MTEVSEEALYARILELGRHRGCLRAGEQFSILGHYLELYGVEWQGDLVKSIVGHELRHLLGHMPPVSVMPEYWPGNLLAALNESSLTGEECVEFLRRMKAEVRMRADLKRVLNFNRPYVAEVRARAMRELLESPKVQPKKRVSLDRKRLKALVKRKKK